MNVPERAVGLIVIGLGLVALSWFRPREKSWLRDWGFPLTGFVGVFLGVVASAVLGVYLFRQFTSHFDPHPGFVVEVLGRVVAVVGPYYLFMICTQLIENIVRRMQGLKPHKIE